MSPVCVLDVSGQYREKVAERRMRGGADGVANWIHRTIAVANLAAVQRDANLADPPLPFAPRAGRRWPKAG